MACDIVTRSEANLFDSHCHPTDIEDSQGVIRCAISAGLHSLLACGYNIQSDLEVARLRTAVPGLPIAVGLHPWHALEAIDDIRALIKRVAPVSIGECGLDAAEDPSIPALAFQYPAFEAQLDLARELSLPVTVHSRRAVSKVWEILSRFEGIRGVLHAYSGSYEQALGFLDRGWCIGIGGSVTRPRAERIRKLARKLPLSGILVETDAPAIGLVDVPPSQVRPAHLPRIIDEIAMLRGVDAFEVIEATDANAAGMFGTRVTKPLSADQCQCPRS